MTALVDKLEKELARNCRLNNWDLGFKAAIDIVKQHSYLISLTERKPTIDGCYLVRYERPWAGNTKTIKKFDVVKFENGRFQILDEYITHWFDLPSEVPMPVCFCQVLPAPPYRRTPAPLLMSGKPQLAVASAYSRSMYIWLTVAFRVQS